MYCRLLLKILTQTKHRAASLRQQSYLLKVSKPLSSVHTEFNTVDFVEPATNRQRSTLLPVCSASTWISMSHVRTQSLVVTSQQISKSFYPSDLIRAPSWLLRNYDATNAVSKLTLTQRWSLIFMKFQHCCRYGQLCCPNVERLFDFVAGVYGTKATRSTCRLSTKSTVLNSTSLPMCTRLKTSSSFW